MVFLHQVVSLMEEMYRERQSFDSRDQRGGKENEDQNGEREEDENDFLRYKSFEKRESERRSKQQLCEAARELVKI